MPLDKSTSKKAFEKNIKTEVKAKEAEGKPKEKAVKQAVAISYAVKRDAAAKKGAETRKKDKK